MLQNNRKRNFLDCILHLGSSFFQFFKRVGVFVQIMVYLFCDVHSLKSFCKNTCELTRTKRLTTESKFIFNIRQINGDKRAASIQNKHSASKIIFENVKGQKSQAIVSFESQTLLFKSGNTLKPLCIMRKRF